MSRRTKRWIYATRRATGVSRKRYSRRRNAYSPWAHIKIKRGATATALVGNPAYVPYLTGETFSLDALKEYTELPDVFDEYRIMMVQLKFSLRYDPASLAGLGGPVGVYPTLWWFIDNTDATAPGSLDVLRATAGAKHRKFELSKPIIITFRPKCLTPAYKGITSGYSAAKVGTWIDANYPDVPHFALKWGIDFHNNTGQYIDIERRYWVQFRNPR